MGPYCKFCDQRCFSHMPAETPSHILEAYRTFMGGSVPIIATCHGGQKFEREKIGYCYDDIQAAITLAKAAVPPITNYGW
jgi:hypothetical protein